MSTSNLPDNAKWQQMFTLVSQHATPSHRELVAEFRHLFLSRLLAENILVFLLQAIGLMMCTLGAHPTPVWLASGTACGFLFMRGASVLPGVWLGTFCAYLLAHSGCMTAFLAATLFSLQAFLLLYFSFRYISPTLIFYQQALFIRFMLLAGALTAMVSCTLVLICFKIWMPLAGLQWWLANLTGVLLFSVSLITLDAFFPQIEDFYRLKKTPIVFYALLMGIALIALLISTSPFATLTSALLLLTLILVISLRFGWCGSIASLFVTGFILDMGTILPSAIYATSFSLETLLYLQALLLLECYLAISLGIKHLSSTMLASK